MTIVAPASPRPWPRHGCPLRAAEDALLLLTTGRAEMAKGVLEGLPALVGEALRSADAEVVRLCAEARDLDARLARPPRARRRRGGPGPPP